VFVGILLQMKDITIMLFHMNVSPYSVNISLEVGFKTALKFDLVYRVVKRKYSQTKTILTRIRQMCNT
jgi:hypothetical protein